MLEGVGYLPCPGTLLTPTRDLVASLFLQTRSCRTCISTRRFTTLAVDAVVSAANRTLLSAGGVGGAIHRAAGPKLREFCETRGPIAYGECVMTPGFDLPARFVIHAAGPVWRGGDWEEEEHLTSCYRRALDLAREANLASVAFPCISTGAYAFPNELAARIAVETVRVHPFAGDVWFVVAREIDLRAYEVAWPKDLPFSVEGLH